VDFPLILCLIIRLKFKEEKYLFQNNKKIKKAIIDMNFRSGWDSGQHDVLSEVSGWKEMRFSAQLPGNTSLLVKDFSVHLIEVFVKNLLKSTTL